MPRLSPAAFIEETTERARPLYIAYTKAMWQAATSGSKQANQREKEAQIEQMRFWADPDRYQLALQLDQTDHDDPITARTLRVIRLSAAKAQQTEQTIQQITELEAKIRSTYYSYRPQVDGQRLSDNQLDEILTESHNSDDVRRAWLASKEVGQQVASDVRQLVEVRNRAARDQGYRDHFARSLQLNEIDETDLFQMFDEIAALTEQPYSNLMAEIRQRRADHFGLAVSQLQPWHFGDRFFQRPPAMGEADFTSHFKGHDPVPLALATYDGWGLEVRDILDRSDLYAREGKNQHAFCLDVDRSGDIRTLNNLEPTHRWIKTLLHELGHAVYDKYIDRDLPWLLRKPPHTLSTEAIAELAETIMAEPGWLAEQLDLSPEQAGEAAAAADRRHKAELLIFTRWVLVMTNFERALYQDPQGDLDQLWWDLKEHYQGLTRPQDRSEPDWAAKYHLALAPVYYQNYLLGQLVAAQLRAVLTAELGGMRLQPAVGDFLKDRVFTKGASLAWDQHVVEATGKPLDPTHYTSLLIGDKEIG